MLNSCESWSFASPKQRNGSVAAIQHIPGKHSIADLFTKEIKDPTHFRNMVFMITSPQLVAVIPPISADLSPQTAIEHGALGKVRQPALSLW
jgi:hypothetical protein